MMSVPVYMAIVEAGPLGCDGVGRVVEELDLFLQPRAGRWRGGLGSGVGVFPRACRGVPPWAPAGRDEIDGGGASARLTGLVYRILRA